MNINVPLTTKAFYPESEIPKNIDSIKRINQKVGDLIRKSALLMNISPALLATLIFVESPDGSTRSYIDKKTGTLVYSQFIGYCQINTKTAVSTVFREFKQKRISTEEIGYLNQLLGQGTVNAIKEAKSDIEVLTQITQSDLHNPAINIFIGAMYLKQCIDKCSSVGLTARLDKAVVLYNKGYYQNIPFSANTDALLKTSIQEESKNYILKMFGATTPLIYAINLFS